MANFLMFEGFDVDSGERGLRNGRTSGTAFVKETVAEVSGTVFAKMAIAQVQKSGLHGVRGQFAESPRQFVSIFRYFAQGLVAREGQNDTWVATNSASSSNEGLHLT